MKVWTEFEAVGIGAGLGKMDIIFIPYENGNILAVHLTTDGRAWVDEKEGWPGPDDEIDEFEMPDKLAEEAIFSFEYKNGRFNEHAYKLLREFVASIKG